MKRRNQIVIFAVLALLVILTSHRASSANDDQINLHSFVRPTSVPYPAFNPPTDEKELLGKLLFFDKRLSGANSMSCASCHQPDHRWTDRRQFSTGETGSLRPRRTQTLEDVGWNRLFARDGRIETLEGFVLGPIAHAKEMNQALELLPKELSADAKYKNMFKTVFGVTSISLDQISMSLAAYVRTISSGTSRFDRWVAGQKDALSPSEKAGFNLFVGKAGCISCHAGWRFSDQSFHDIGIKTTDRGRGLIAPDDRYMQFAFKTPSLRNVANRGPFMHDGSLQTLADVIKFYTESPESRPSLSPQRQRLDLTNQEKVNLFEFINSLTDDSYRSDSVRVHRQQ